MISSFINLHRLLLLLAVFFLSSCAGSLRDRTGVSPFLNTSVGKVAVLPFSNGSNDIAAPEVLRKEAARRIAERGYTVLGLAETDEKLRGLGFTDGGQLTSAKTDELAKELDAGILCYGDLEDFTYQNVGFVIRKKVKLKITLLAAGGGEPLFQSTGEKSDFRIYTNMHDAQAAFLVHSAVKLTQNMAGHPLWTESKVALDKIFSHFPVK